jgi:hypothetical protein
VGCGRLMSDGILRRGVSGRREIQVEVRGGMGDEVLGRCGQRSLSGGRDPGGGEDGETTDGKGGNLLLH